jgi:two-component system response regulator MprA
MRTWKFLQPATGLKALPIVNNQKPDLIVLDWMMPEMNGLEFIQRLRDEEDQTVVLMLTARDAIANRVEGLESGADDYLVKPFAPAELVARVHAMLRRVNAKPENQKASYADLTLDPSTREAWRGDMAVSLTVTEFKLLHMLLRHPRQVLERRQILNEVWGYDFGGDDNVLEIYIGYLRRKLEAGGDPRLIQTVRGVGYVLREE